jgi:hypothetical protein
MKPDPLSVKITWHARTRPWLEENSPRILKSLALLALLTGIVIGFYHLYLFGEASLEEIRSAPRSVVVDGECFHTAFFQEEDKTTKIITTSGWEMNIQNGSYRMRKGHICDNPHEDPGK